MILKRLCDIAFAVFWLVLTAPIMAVVAICIKLDSPGPILYVPKMVGYRGALFPFFRFRTMSLNDSAGNDHHMFTRVGRLIRNYSLDHIPTLVNILLGDLTIVGPRPMEVDRVDMHDPIWKQYFHVKPGYINYAVLKMGKSWTPSRISDPERNQELEIEYISKRSTLFDGYIFARSMYAFIKSKGNIKARKAPD
jgi:lipopolysaccharide/colanic/teichoic acid biosynthesis glycosyltransferase